MSQNSQSETDPRELSQRDLHRFTHVDHHDRVALVATLDGEIIGIGRFDRIDPTSAEVANATNSGEPIVASHPKHAVSQAINHLADLVVGEQVAAPGKSKKAKSDRSESPRRGLRRRQGR